MNCEEIADLMDGYLDGELDTLTSQKIEQHLRECHKCEEAFEADTALAHAISTSAPITRPPLSCVSGFNRLYETQSVRKIGW